ncbi:MAG: winged helix-turn-helix domain-containing protein, partial [Blastocatellia bacterium]
MASSVPKKRYYEFGSFRIDVRNRLLYQGSEVVQLQLKTFDLLLLLVESQGRVLEKAELMNRVWPDTAVEESNLTQHIYTLRKLFSAEPEGGKYIETIPRRGYRFVARVDESRSEVDDPAREETRASPDHVQGRVISFPYSSNLAPAPIADQETAEPDQEADPRRHHTTEGASPSLTVAEGARV